MAIPDMVFLDTGTLGNTSFKPLEEIGTLRIFKNTSFQERIQNIGNSPIVITNKVNIDKEVMDGCPNLRLICITATGINNIDTIYAMQKGIQVKNVAGYSTYSVAQATFAMLFKLIHQLDFYDNHVKSLEYSRSPFFTNLEKGFFELKDKIHGIIGMGEIGRQVAKIAEAFGANVIYYSTSGKNLKQDYPRVGLDELLSKSDIVSIHAPLNEQTYNLVPMDKLKLMKQSAILVNVGRGGIVNEADLATAIDGGMIGGACIDVFENEPIEEENPLMQLSCKDKVVYTPHNAWGSAEARKSLIQKTANNIREFLNSI